MALVATNSEIRKRMATTMCCGLLLIAVVVSAIAVVESVHRNRKLFAELQQLQKVADESRVEWGKLLLEQSSYAAYSRIETMANEKLLMKAPDIEEVIMVDK